MAKKKQVKRPWSEEEKAAVLDCFGHHILQGKIPGKKDIEDCMKKYPFLQKRTWKNIKDFVRNQIASKKTKLF